MTTATIEVASVEAAAPPQAQPPEGVTVGDLKAGAFTRVKRDFTNPQDAINILNFVDFLAQNNSTSADTLLLPVKKGKWELGRTEVTKLFFGHLESAQELAKKDIKLPDDGAKAAIMAAFQSRMKNAEASVKRSIESHLNDADQKAALMVHALTAARKLQEEMDAIRGDKGESKLKDLMERLPLTGWNFHQFHGGYMEFTSRTDVVLRYIEEKAGLRYELNCGRFRARFNISNMTVMVFGHARTSQRFEGDHKYIHPHIRYDGTVCFGNGADAYNRCVVNGDIIGTLMLLDKMLPYYNSASPYINIEEFKKTLVERDRLEQEAHVKKEKAKEQGVPAGLEDNEILDDDPDLADDVIWDEGAANE